VSSDAVGLAAHLALDNAAESALAYIPEAPCSDEIYLFHETFPNCAPDPLFQRLEEIVKRKLSSTERFDIIKACLRLVESKKNAKTPEAFREELSLNNEEKKRLSDALQEIYSLSGQLIKGIDRLKKDIVTEGLLEKRAFIINLYEPLDAFSSPAPIDQVLHRIRHTSENAIAECKPKGKRGQLPDTELRLCIAELIRVFGDKPTAGYSRKEGRRASPLIDFVESILFALPEEAMTGTGGPYTGGAIEAHVAAVCADLRKRPAG